MLKKNVFDNLCETDFSCLKHVEKTNTVREIELKPLLSRIELNRNFNRIFLLLNLVLF